MSTGAAADIDKCNTATDVNMSANNAGGLVVGQCRGNAEINVGEDVTLTRIPEAVALALRAVFSALYTYSDKADNRNLIFQNSVA